MTGADWTIVAGALLQVFGVGLIVADIISSTRARDSYVHRTRTIYLSGSVGGEGRLTATAEGGREPDLTERVEILERRLSMLEHETLPALEETIEATARHHASQAASHVHKTLNDERDALFDLVRSTAVGNVRRRLWGVAFVIAGIAVQAVGSILS